MSLSAPSLPAPRLLAILAADAAGYSRMMAIDDRLSVELLDAARAVFRSACEAHQGRVVDMAGNSVLLAFDSAASALRCALAVQQRLTAAQNFDVGTLRLPFRIGVHLGDVIQKDDGSVDGEGVNIAARLQALAEPDEVFVSQSVRDLLGAKPLATFQDAGEHRLKNVAEAVRAWRALPPGSVPAAAAAASAATPGATLRFGPQGRFELQPLERRLLVDGQPANLGARAFDLLLVLAAEPGQLKTKNELLEAVWPGVIVEEGNLATQISTLRKVLGGDVIATIPGRGYRFAAPVTTASAARAEGAPATAAHTVAGLAPPATRPPEALRTNLPTELTPLLGRADELAAVGELVDQHRLVTIVGAGGMGKTLLAQHLLAGRRATYAHGVCFVDLAPVTTREAVASTIAAALGLSLGAGGDPLRSLCAAVAPLALLVALDNAEHLIDTVAEVAAALRESAPALRLLVTSQLPLKLAAERVYRIGALAVPQGPLPAAEAREFGAVALFAERAQAADSRFTLTDANAPAVITLCRQLDGLALAIELAAARAPMLGVQRLAAAMDQRLKLLTAGRNRAAPARQQTLRAALEWSHGFLDEAERAVFRRLAVFAGSGSLAMVQQVVADPPDEGPLDEWAVLDVLALLVDRSLVVAFTTDAGEPRYRLLETPRLFALERLQEAGEEEQLRQRHALAFAQRFDEAWDEAFSGEIGRDAWVEAVSLDVDNGWQAWHWACAADDRISALRIAVTLLRAPSLSAPHALAALRDRCEPWLEASADPDLHARIASSMSGPIGRVSRERSERLLDAAFRRLAGSTDTPRQRWLSYMLLCDRCIDFCGSAKLEAAREALAEALRREDPSWPLQRRVWAVEAAYHLAASEGQHAQARDRLRQLEASVQAMGGQTYTIQCNLVDLLLAAGDAAAAVPVGQQAVAALAGVRLPQLLTLARVNLAAACLALDNTVQARTALQAGWPQAPAFQYVVVFADYLSLLAALESRPHTAARLTGHADAVNAASGPRDRNEAAAIARTQALARAALGDAEFERLHAEGTTLREADIGTLAFGTDDTA